ncbi:MAG: Cof-type HAD-IIB family hydrolase [Intestinibacter bartlettii]|uniref:Cof-type HAD-IIB family hydrolase n=1 Tax=Intestinibacter bartlettii TaxID=261299 RepID=UPI0026EA4288|nr:Cof-type HAD-IIB family hydrolase [Intestinibacter bartlettii]MDO5010980.1 Cof-type HAD-IIB family hydrolase [Intestinibacter bartlettii]
MSNRKILFFDIDGTLISETSGEIPESTKNALKTAQENGHITIINTGRTRALIEPRLQDMGFDGYICGCGTYIEINNKVLYYKTIDKHKYKEIIQVLKENETDMIIEGTENIYMDLETTDPVRQKRIKEFTDRGFPIKSLSSSDLSFDKFCFTLQNTDKRDNIVEYLENEGFDYIDRGANFFEVVPKGHSKASGMEFLLNYFNLEKEDSYAFGDSYNDTAMFEYCPNGVLMANGKKDLSKIVSFVTKDVDEDGIEYALQHFNIV